MPDPVIVVGGDLAGLAAAARLAKAGHLVELYERSDTLGGTWAPYRLLSGHLINNAPPIIGFPAPWRDLFRKSGRPWKRNWPGWATPCYLPSRRT